MVGGHAADHRQLARIEDAGFGAEPPQEALGLQRQKPAIGPYPKQARSSAIRVSST
jgi:hypothetical protein